MRVHLTRLGGRRVASGADGPDRFVGEDKASEFLDGHTLESLLHLPIEYIERLVGLALLEGFANADDRRQLRIEGCSNLLVDAFVCLAEGAAAVRSAR